MTGGTGIITFSYSTKRPFRRVSKPTAYDDERDVYRSVKVPPRHDPNDGDLEERGRAQGGKWEMGRGGRGLSP